jgi:hypothetical protein
MRLAIEMKADDERSIEIKGSLGGAWIKLGLTSLQISEKIDQQHTLSTCCI